MSKYRAAVIGLGNIGLLYDNEPQRPHPSTHTWAYNESVAFKLVCGIDSDERKGDLLKKICPEAEFYVSVKEAVKAGALNEIDVVSVATPPVCHLQNIRDIITSGVGRIVFCEKPIVKDSYEISELHRMTSDHPEIIVIPNISRRWNSKLRMIADIIDSGRYGKVEKINIRYTRGIYNTGAHLFDLLKMWCGASIEFVITLGKTQTTAEPEPSYSFYFVMTDGATGYAEAVNDEEYYLFDVDVYLSYGKIEMRYSGDVIRIFTTEEHHLFRGFKELSLLEEDSGVLSDNCMMNAIDNIEGILNGTSEPYCTLEDSIYPLYVADALIRSEKSGVMEKVFI